MKLNINQLLKPVFLLLPLLNIGCVGTPAGVTPVQGFDVDRYLGRWYEIARLDHSFERGLEKVSAEYKLEPDGSISVSNRGYLPKQEKWKEATGRALFVDNPSEAHLKVSFFGPFYSSYVVFDLDETNYQYAFVSGANTKYLWLLARTPTVDEGLKKKFKTKAAELGFAVDTLIWVEHQP
ncbi:MAG: lipocalin family protein [Desulfocapsaceae bacterium]